MYFNAPVSMRMPFPPPRLAVTLTFNLQI